MYKNFFGFKERPFKLVHDPTYLFLSKIHELALAHLNYALIQGDGFVEITGEIGTGKTTLCRAFLENLDGKTKAAYIFNPKLNSIQLLKAINNEFGVSSHADNTKDLIDTLNAFLIEEKAKGANVILVIDEAQTLDDEVLEQVRLLSNLETTKHKLLQIVLAGQPELGERLDSYELRQLGQRITLSCQLIPLSYTELTQYIQHRISIASRKPAVKFTRSAYKAIYQYSRGIPRLINIVCDRALLTAYGLEQEEITGDIAKAAIKELAGRGDIKRYSLQKRKRAIAFLSTLFLAVLVVIFYRYGFLSLNKQSDSPKSKIFESLLPKQFKKPDHKITASELKPTMEKDKEKSKSIKIDRPGIKNQEPSAEPVEVKFPEDEQVETLEPVKTTNPKLVSAQGEKPIIEYVEKKIDKPVVEEYFAVGSKTPIPSTLVKESDKRLTVSEKWKPSKLPVRTNSNLQGLDIEAQAGDKAGQSHEIKALSSNKIIVKSIKFKVEKDREKVFIALNNFSTPKILTLDGDKPRIVIDIKNVSFWSGRYRTPVNGNLIKQIRTYLHRDTEKLRIVLDINPSENYFIGQIYNQTENIYSIEVR